MVNLTTTSIYALFATALATTEPNRVQKRNNLASVAVPVPTDVANAINEWEIDVNTVNSFLQNAAVMLDDLPELATGAGDALNLFAAEEPNQLGTLVNWFAATNPNNPDVPSDAFNCATNDLANGTTSAGTTFNFKNLVENVFSDIVDDAQAGNRDGVSNLLDIVNRYRCCNVLPDLDIIWRDSAISANLALKTDTSDGGVSFSPSRYAACSAIDCSTVENHSTCASLDNEGFGVPGSS
jgi:hypothetical protein